MGIVIKQSAANLLITCLGFILGAVNVLFLATTYLDNEYYGLWGYVLSVAFILFPFMSLGIHNTIVKFYSRYNTKEDRDAFLTQMLLWPFIVIIPLAIITFFGFEWIQEIVSIKNSITRDFVWAIFLIAVFQAYFEIFYAWTKVQMKTIFGNFLKEVFYRAAACFMLILVAIDMITQREFIYSLVVIYAVRMLIMKVVALQLYMPRLRIGKWHATSDLWTYSILMMVAGSVGTAMLDLDKTMINQYLVIDSISWYNVAVFIATVIAVPARGMAQITHPLTATYFNNNQLDQVSQLYKRSSLNLMLVSGLMMVIIICNVHEFYKFLPDEFVIGIPVVFLIAVIKFLESVLGSNNAILYNSNLYKVTLWLGLFLVLIAVLFNLWLIPIYGILGAAIATCIAYILYAMVKMIYVYYALNMHPWTGTSWGSLGLITMSIVVFYFWDFSFHPVINIALKSTLIVVFYVSLLLYFNLSSEIKDIYKKINPFI